MMPNTLTGVIFDHSTIFPSLGDTTLIDELRTLISNIKAAGLKIGVFSTHHINLRSKLLQYNYPAADLLVTFRDVGEKKGGKKWIRLAAQKLNTTSFQLLYVGDSKEELNTATNADFPTFYAQAKWSEKAPLVGRTAFVSSSPSHLWRFITHYLLTPPRWIHKLDDLSRGICLRSLVGGNFTLPASTPASFNAKHIFIDKIPIQVGSHPAREIFMTHAITSLYLEGLIELGCKFTTYPGSKVGKVNDVAEDYLIPVSKVFHGYYLENLLVRAADAPDTSIEKFNRRPTPITYQTNTVHLNPEHRRRIEGKSVIVFDDFTTSGKSLEWARNLLKAGGARQVILITAGKFKYSHEVYTPINPSIINPFDLSSYALTDFRTHELSVEYLGGNESILSDSFRYIKDSLPLPH